MLLFEKVGTNKLAQLLLLFFILVFLLWKLDVHSFDHAYFHSPPIITKSLGFKLIDHLKYFVWNLNLLLLKQVSNYF